MRIAQVAPLFESVPPVTYGGTERVVSYLTEELIRQGHQVTLFASGDSLTAARLIPCTPRALRLDPLCIDQLAHQIVQLEKVYRMSGEFDIIHFHIDYFHFPLSRRHLRPVLTTLHGRLDIPDLQSVYREFDEMPVVSISNTQRTHLPWINWQGTVYHGLPSDQFTFRERQGTYLAFLGRISPEKRVDRAIRIAQRSGIKLKIAAKVDKADREYYRREIKPHLARAKHAVEYIGEIGDMEKDEFLGNAYALLFPIEWPEPFGLVMIEAMACGTPIIAYNRGSVPEVMENGVTGYIVDSEIDAVTAVEQIAGIDRTGCRRKFEEKYTVDRMAHQYVHIYRKLLRSRPTDGISTDAVQRVSDASYPPSLQ